MKKFVTLEKAVGETPLAALEKYRSEHPELANTKSARNFWMQMSLLQALRRKSHMWLYGDKPNVPKEREVHQKYPPMAYAGRLDPMASGKLLVLIGDECKRQKSYHALDKEYEFSVLLGVSSDTGDVLGRLSATTQAPQCNLATLEGSIEELQGEITLPYPHFSAKTVAGKPLHVWTLENRLDEITIPTYCATIHRLTLTRSEEKTGAEVADEALLKIATIPPVTEQSKALGQDFRRKDVRTDWREFKDRHRRPTPFSTSPALVHQGSTCARSLNELQKYLAQKVSPSPFTARK